MENRVATLFRTAYLADAHRFEVRSLPQVVSLHVNAPFMIAPGVANFGKQMYVRPNMLVI